MASEKKPELIDLAKENEESAKKSKKPILNFFTKIDKQKFIEDSRKMEAKMLKLEK